MRWKLLKWFEETNNGSCCGDQPKSNLTLASFPSFCSNKSNFVFTPLITTRINHWLSFACSDLCSRLEYWPDIGNKYRARPGNFDEALLLSHSYSQRESFIKSFKWFPGQLNDYKSWNWNWSKVNRRREFSWAKEERVGVICRLDVNLSQTLVQQLLSWSNVEEGELLVSILLSNVQCWCYRKVYV